MSKGQGGGRKPKPLHLKLVEGMEERYINRDEPLPSEAGIVKPAGMSEPASAVWDELAPDLVDKGVLKPWDVYTFETFCEAVAKYRICRDLLEVDMGEGRYMARGAAGGLIKSPYHQMMRDHVETMAKIGSRFGLTPSDRANLQVKASDGPALGAERILG